MKFKNLIIITITLTFFALVVSLVMGFTTVEIPVLLPGNLRKYQLFASVRIFCDFIPAILGTAFVLGWGFEFGKNYEGSRMRFSQNMLKRYKMLLISALLIDLFLTCFAEIVLPNVNKNMKKMEEMPKLVEDYKNFAQNMYDAERYELSYEFAKMSLEISPNDKSVRQILDNSKIALNKIDIVESDLSSIDMENILPSKTDLSTTASNTKVKNQHSQSYELLLMAEKCLENEEWFNAHYYAQEALKLITEKDVNYKKLKHTASEAWNEISKTRFAGTSDEQKVFAKKFEGYSALLEHDNLHAYYVFKNLHDSGKILSLDPDVERYLDISEQRLEKQYFFTDETIGLQNFEHAKNVRFKIQHDDGTTDIYFIKGITSTGKKGNLIQYFRGMSIFCLDAQGNYLSGSYTPYAKMKEISTSYFDEFAKKELKLDEDLKIIPYILLNSVDRKKEGVINTSILKDGDSQFTQHGFIILPIEASDFYLLKEASSNIDTMNIISIIKFLKIAEKYGYSQKVYTQTILNKLLYPIFILIILITLGVGAWHGRLPPNSLFKFKWIMVFPIFVFVAYLLYKFVNFIFKLINYSVLGFSSTYAPFLLACIIYLIGFVLISVLFVACKNSMNSN